MLIAHDGTARFADSFFAAPIATVDRRVTAITKLIEIDALVNNSDPTADPTKHPLVSTTPAAIRRRLGTDQDQAAPLTADILVQTLLSLDRTTLAGQRDTALLLIGWYGAPGLRVPRTRRCRSQRWRPVPCLAVSSVFSHLIRLSIARLGLLLVSGDKRDAEILA